ncbi:MAG: hypothetical protein K0S45_1783 [Nitrospira sp.]|nr:hypothetical protein [Nitrospira sp.]
MNVNQLASVTISRCPTERVTGTRSNEGPAAYEYQICCRLATPQEHKLIVEILSPTRS